MQSSIMVLETVFILMVDVFFPDSHGAECERDRPVCQRRGLYYKTSSCNRKKQL